MNCELPNDPFILLSYVNTKLRDQYASLTEFCAAIGCEQSELEQKLGEAGFEYSEENNKFW